MEKNVSFDDQSDNESNNNTVKMIKMIIMIILIITTVTLVFTFSNDNDDNNNTPNKVMISIHTGKYDSEILIEQETENKQRNEKISNRKKKTDKTHS